jgi:2-pyrone-4,6-dicarboxylate lactonase
MQDLDRPANTFRKDTRVPSTLPPAGSCDTQFHAYGPTATYPWTSTRTHDPQADASFEEAERMHRTLGIDRGVYVQPTAYGLDYRFILDTLKGRENYRGTTLIDDTTTDQQLEQLHAVGVRGVRLSLVTNFGFTTERKQFERSVARVKELGWHIKIRSRGESILENADLYRTLRVPVVIDHMGHLDTSRGVSQPACQLILELLKNGDNWWIMLGNADRMSDFPWDASVPIAQAFIAAAPDRMMWATDWPHNEYTKPCPNDADLLNVLSRYAPDEAVRKRILVDNPARLYDFPQ